MNFKETFNLQNRLVDFARKQYRGLPMRVYFWNGWQLDLTPSPEFGIRILKPAGALALLRPDLGGIGKAYVEGSIDIEGHPQSVIRIIDDWTSSRKRSTLPAWRPRRRGRKRDMKAVQYHYDVSDEFFQLFLDPELVYSCAYFRTGNQTLERAQEEKLDLICKKLVLKPGDEFLDIGCGWGALMRWAARQYGVRATGITISENQYKYAVRKLREEGLDKNCEVHFIDYRDFNPDRKFDKIASVGMFEHVGLAQMDQYFKKTKDLMSEGGLILNHGICATSLDNREIAGNVGAFMDEYVFPYGELPHISVVTRTMAAQGFEVADVESLRPHYARTLTNWYDRLENKRDLAIQIAGNKRYRIWRAYLSGCAHAFERGWMSIYQVLASRQSQLGSWVLPHTREHLYKDGAASS